MSSLDSTHTVVIKRENRGLNALLGIVVCVLLFRWWWTGSLWTAIVYMLPEPVRHWLGFESISGSILSVLIPMLFDLLVLIGMASAFVASELWDVIYLGLQWVKAAVATRAAVKTAQAAAQNAASAVSTSTAETVAVSQTTAATTLEDWLVLNLNKIADSVNDLSDRLFALEKKSANAKRKTNNG